MSEQQALDVADVARIYKLSTATVYRMAATGEIPAFKVGRGTGRWRFWGHEVQKAFTDRDPWRRSNQARARRAATTRRRAA